MDPDEIYDDIDIPEDQNVDLKRKRNRKIHSSEYVSKKKESYVKCVEKNKDQDFEEGNNFADVLRIL